MPGKRLRDPSLTRTTFPEVVANNGEILTDWEVNNPSNQLVWARPIPLKLIGNAWWQGSYDGVTWDNYVKDDHAYARLSTDGGETWLVFTLSSCNPGDGDHPPVTIGTPDGGLVISGDDTQVLTLNPSGPTGPGSMSSTHWIKLTNLKFDFIDNIGGGYEIFKDYTDVDDVRTHHLRTLVAGANTTLSYVGDTIVINSNTSSTTGQANTGHNDGTLGYGVFDRMNGDILEFRHIATTGDIIDITLDDVNNNILLEVVEGNIDHNSLENYVINEHIDHSTVLLSADEGIAIDGSSPNSGDLTASRAFTLSFDTLGGIVYDENDYIAVYDSDTDLHYKIPLSALPWGDEDTVVTLTATEGVGGGGLLDQNRSVYLAFNDLTAGTYDPANDYIAFWDYSENKHKKTLLSALSVSISAGDGMNFTTITGTGTVDMGTPTTLTKLTTDLASGTTHEHEVNLSTWDLQDLGNVDTPVDTYYVYYDLATNTFKFGDPAIGATTPGAPVNSIQFNDANTFGGSSGLLYIEAEDRIYMDAQIATDAGIIFGDSSSSPSIYGKTATTSYIKIDNAGAQQDYVQVLTGRMSIGQSVLDGDTFLEIQDENTSNYTNAIKVSNILDEVTLKLESTGAFYLPAINSATTSNVLYFNSLTGEVTFGAGGGTGSSQTLIADGLSGLMVNGGSTSSADTIELDQNDNKLDTSTPIVTDYIGFWDESENTQKKFQIGNLPGWILYKDGVLQEEINPGEILNFVGGSGVNLTYNSSTNALTIATDGTSGGGCSQLVADLGTKSSGTANLDLDVYSGAIIELTSGGTIEISMDNLEEGDTGHIEVTHTGSETLTFTTNVGATIKIAANSYSAANTVALTTGGAAIDVVAFWYAKGNLHLAVIYDMN